MPAQQDAIAQRRQIEDNILRKLITLYDDVEIEVFIDETVGEAARNYIDNMLSLRNIPDVSDVSPMHPAVMELYADNLKMAEDESVPEPFRYKALSPEQVAEIYKTFVNRLHSIVQTEGFIVALISKGTLYINGKKAGDLFVPKKTTTGINYTELHPKIKCNPVPVDFFEPKELNDNENNQLLPKIPQKNPGSIAEQRLALIETLRETHPEFNFALSQFFTDYMKDVLAVLHDATVSEGSGDVDDDGFHSGGVDGNMDAEADPQDKNAKRGKRTTKRKVPTSPGND
jgi:hypothetical protein